MSELDIYKININGNIWIHTCYEWINILSRLFDEVNKEEVYFAKNIIFDITLDFIPWNILIVLWSIIMELESQWKHVTLNMPPKLYDFILHSWFSDYINTKKNLSWPLSKSVILPFSRLSNQADFIKYSEHYRDNIPSDERDMIVWYIWELHYNSLEHWDTQDIFLISQKYPNLGYLDISIYDSWKWILNTNKWDIFLKVYAKYCSEKFFSLYYACVQNSHLNEFMNEDYDCGNCRDICLLTIEN